MPIFDFRCEQCGHEFEKLVFRRDAEVPCPNCQGPVKKMPSRFSVRGVGPTGTGAGSGSSCGSCSSGNCSSCGGH